MCPVCLASVGLIVAGAVSTGGLTVLAVKASFKKKAAEGIFATSKEGANQEVHERGKESMNHAA